MVLALALLGLTPAGGHAAEPALPACLAGAPVNILVRFGDAPARLARLRGGVQPPLALFDAEDGRLLWSAAATPPANQLFAAMHASFAGSLLPLDLDGDGAHDRLYAGDLAGRLWRFDLHHGQPPASWATGGVFAELASGTARGFLAPPDVSLSATPPAAVTVAGAGPLDAPAWFNLALGTARIGSAPVDNRFYVLRDPAPFEAWTAAQYARWRPLRESDLVELPRLGAALEQPAPNGYFIVVGGADILVPSLTVAGRATLAMADRGGTPTECAIRVAVSSIDLDTGLVRGATRDALGQTVPTRVSLPSPQPFSLVRAGSHAQCRLGDTPIPDCDVDLSPRRTWWRREDAD